jgi:hypothetical protein
MLFLLLENERAMRAYAGRAATHQVREALGALNGGMGKIYSSEVRDREGRH